MKHIITTALLLATLTSCGKASIEEQAEKRAQEIILERQAEAQKAKIEELANKKATEKITGKKEFTFEEDQQRIAMYKELNKKALAEAMAGIITREELDRIGLESGEWLYGEREELPTW